MTKRSGGSALPQLGNPQPVRFGAVLDRFLAPGERLGDGAQAHALAGEQVELLDLILPPRLAVAFELFAVGHIVPSTASGPPPLQKQGRRQGHLTLSTCSNSSSTGVARPKIDTDTLTRPRSKSNSSTTPLKLANGPSSTLTESPTSYAVFCLKKKNTHVKGESMNAHSKTPTGTASPNDIVRVIALGALVDTRFVTFATR